MSRKYEICGSQHYKQGITQPPGQPMNYIWQHKHWPNFSYDSNKLSVLAYQYAKQAAQLSGSLSQTDQDDSIAAQLDLMVDEAINTSLIEGENLNPASVRSSLQNYLNLTPTPINVADVKAEGMAALIVDVRKHFSQPLSKEMLFNWHRMVLAGFEDNILHSDLTVGQWRDSPEPMQIVSGPVGYERVHYEAPAAQDLDALMADFLNWFNQQDTHPEDQQNKQQIPGVIRAGIAHLWFEVIHPFDDGNGRIGRAIIEYALAQDLGMPVMLSMSTHIERNKKEYYRQLNAASCCDASELDDPAVLDITVWLSWFIETLIAAQQEAAEKVATIFAKTEFWQRHKNTELSERQKTVLNKIFKAGQAGFPNGVSAQKYAALGKCSKATATRDLADLLAKDCVRSEGVGRGLRYFITA
ncbi:MAG: cell filamentation protein Fic [Oceanospirillaceae bacterium]|nr:cell filamentation protein Fic [Oceanospirillaceae bacterium]MAY00140.1 cell filamentation protein Fic [Oceanospirillaceae bacterium]MBS52276.1 cell filamentation protein Fic [Oceanospirillaceae bacterium]